MRLPVIFIFLTVVIDSMGIGIMMPVMPDLLREVGQIDLASAAIWGGILSTVFAVNQFLFSPLLGSLSDRYGRRPVLMLSLLVMVLDYLVMALSHSIWVLLIARMVGGVTAATHSTANAYMADISTDENKAQNFGLLGAAFGMGFIFGPMLGGLLAEFGTRAPFYGAAALAFANLVLGFFALPESVTDKIRRPFEWRRANPFAAFHQVRKLPGMLPLLMVFLLMNIAFYVYPSVWAYYGRAQFGWDARMVGYSLAAYGLGVVAVQGGLIRFVIPKYGAYWTALAGISLHTVALCLYAFFTATWQIFVFMPFAVLSNVATPAVQGLLSNAVPDNAQGELQGVMSSLAAVAVIVSPLAMTSTFSWFTSARGPVYLPGAPFILAALFTAIATVVLLVYRQRA